MLLEAESMKFPMAPSGIEPACSAVPQPTAPTRVPWNITYRWIFKSSGILCRFDWFMITDVSKTLCFIESLINIYQPTRRYMSEDFNLQQQRHRQNVTASLLTGTQPQRITYETSDRSQHQQKTWQILSSSYGISSV